MLIIGLAYAIYIEHIIIIISFRLAQYSTGPYRCLSGLRLDFSFQVAVEQQHAIITRVTDLNMKSSSGSSEKRSLSLRQLWSPLYFSFTSQRHSKAITIAYPANNIFLSNLQPLLKKDDSESCWWHIMTLTLSLNLFIYIWSRYFFIILVICCFFCQARVLINLIKTVIWLLLHLAYTNIQYCSVRSCSVGSVTCIWISQISEYRNSRLPRYQPMADPEPAIGSQNQFHDLHRLPDLLSWHE